MFIRTVHVVIKSAAAFLKLNNYQYTMKLKKYWLFLIVLSEFFLLGHNFEIIS